MGDLIDRNDAIMAVKMGALSAATLYGRTDEGSTALYETVRAIKAIPSVQPEKRTEERTEKHACDLIDRQAAIDALGEGAMVNYQAAGHGNGLIKSIDVIKGLPSAQPERTCVNCGRTVNNGGWYADGGTRCPIEEHYALPKDGYCHLWEKRNVTDDDYPERREE